MNSHFIFIVLILSFYFYFYSFIYTTEPLYVFNYTLPCKKKDNTDKINKCNREVTRSLARGLF